MNEYLLKKEIIESDKRHHLKTYAIEVRKIFVMIFVAMIMFFSTANANTETFEGTGVYPTTGDKIQDKVKELAKKEAIQDALEKASIAFSSQTKVENPTVTKDVIKVTAGSILKVLSDKYNFVPLHDIDGTGIYKATVIISIDTYELNLKLQDFLKKEFNEQSMLTKQYEELQKLNDTNTKRIVKLEKQFEEKISSQNIKQIKSEIEEIDRNILYTKKFMKVGRLGKTRTLKWR